MFGMRSLALIFVWKESIQVYMKSYSLSWTLERNRKKLQREGYSKEKSLKVSIDACWMILENILLGQCYISLPGGTLKLKQK